MRHRRHRGAAALQAHVVDIHLCVVGLQAAFHAESYTPSGTAVGGEVHDHLLPARALVDMQGVDGHELACVTPRVGTDTHQQARGGARRVEPEAQVQAVERGLARYRRGYGHAVVALGYGAGIESQRCGAAVHRHRHQMRRIAHVVVARHNPAGWRHLHAGAVAVKGLLPRCSHTVALPLRRHRQGCHKHHQHRQSQHPATELLMCCQYLPTIMYNARVCEILCRPSLFLFTAQRLHP